MTPVKYGFILVIVTLLLFSCTRKSKLQGKWRVLSYILYDRSMGDTLKLDFKDKSAFALLRDHIPSSWSAMSDDEYFRVHSRCFLQLKKDSTFFLRDLGFVFPTSSAMLFEKETKGRWSFDQTSQLLVLQSIKDSHRYKIVKDYSDSLLLSESFGHITIDLKLIKK